jgi:hypothetical protein
VGQDAEPSGVGAQFLARAVAWLAKVGVGQFLDVGAGLPTAQNTHQVAQQVNPACVRGHEKVTWPLTACRVVYADNDRCKSSCAHARWIVQEPAPTGMSEQRETAGAYRRRWSA